MPILSVGADACHRPVAVCQTTNTEFCKVAAGRCKHRPLQIRARLSQICNKASVRRGEGTPPYRVVMNRWFGTPFKCAMIFTSVRGVGGAAPYCEARGITNF